MGKSSFYFFNCESLIESTVFDDMIQSMQASSLLRISVSDNAAWPGKNLPSKMLRDSVGLSQ